MKLPPRPHLKVDLEDVIESMFVVIAFLFIIQLSAIFGTMLTYYFKGYFGG